MRERADEGGHLKPGRLAGQLSLALRLICLAWLAAAILFAAAPGAGNAAPQGPQVASTFGPLGPTILRQDLASAYFVGLRARLEWSRSSDRPGSAATASHFGLAPSAQALRGPDDTMSAGRAASRAGSRAADRPFDARAPPLRR